MLNKRLSNRKFIAKSYSIADMAVYPWIVPYERQGRKLEDFPHLKRWFEAMREREGVKRAYAPKAPTPSKPRRFPSPRFAEETVARACRSRSTHQLVTACGSNKDGRSSGIFFDFLP